MKDENWSWELSSRQSWFNLDLAGLAGYKDLLFSFVRRELKSGYHQTAMGAFWIVLQPLLTTMFYLLVFGNIVKISTDNISPVLFYLSGIIIWSFFSDCLSGAMYSFIKNAHIFNKVYFPRLLVPFSMVITHAIRFGIQFLLFVLLFLYYGDAKGINLNSLLWLPLLIIQIAALGLGIGLIVSTLMVKYRDMDQIMQFTLRLFMFLTPVVYPASLIPQQYEVLYWLNPVTPVIETFRSILFSHAPVKAVYLLVGAANTVMIVAIGLLMFKRREITAMDTI